MAAYRRVYDSRHLQADMPTTGYQVRNNTLGNRVWATFTFFVIAKCRGLCLVLAKFHYTDPHDPDLPETPLVRAGLRRSRARVVEFSLY